MNPFPIGDPVVTINEANEDLLAPSKSSKTTCSSRRNTTLAMRNHLPPSLPFQDSLPDGSNMAAFIPSNLWKTSMSQTVALPPQPIDRKVPLPANPAGSKTSHRITPGSPIERKRQRLLSPLLMTKHVSFCPTVRVRSFRLRRRRDQRETCTDGEPNKVGDPHEDDDHDDDDDDNIIDPTLIWYGPELRRKVKKSIFFLKKKHLQQQSTGCEQDARTAIAGDAFLRVFPQVLEQCQRLSPSPGESVALLNELSVQSPARGLESYLFPELNARRSRIIQKMLKAQRLLQSSPRSPLTADERSTLLREISIQLTRPSRHLAEYLAWSDYQVVLEYCY